MVIVLTFRVPGGHLLLKIVFLGKNWDPGKMTPKSAPRTAPTL